MILNAKTQSFREEEEEEEQEEDSPWTAPKIPTAALTKQRF